MESNDTDKNLTSRRKKRSLTQSFTVCKCVTSWRAAPIPYIPTPTSLHPHPYTINPKLQEISETAFIQCTQLISHIYGLIYALIYVLINVLLYEHSLQSENRTCEM